jgi:hypothetical protein
MIPPFPKWCPFLEKFELILKKIVKLLARSSVACGGLATPVRRLHPPHFLYFLRARFFIPLIKIIYL